MNNISAMEYVRPEINRRFARGVNALFQVCTRAQSETRRILADSISGVSLEVEENRRLALCTK